MSQQMLEKANDIFGTIGTLLRHQQKGAFRSYTADGRYVIPAETHAQNDVRGYGAKMQGGDLSPAPARQGTSPCATERSRSPIG